MVTLEPDDLAGVIADAIKASTAQLLSRVAELEQRMATFKVEAGPPGQPGKDGEPGRDGTNGIDGKDGAPGRDGKDGESIIGPMGLTGPEGVQGKDGAEGKEGTQGPQGADGVGLAAAVIGQGGELILTCSDGSIKALGVVVGKDGAPGRDGERGTDGVGVNGKDGKDGQDALGFDDIDVQHDGERSFTFKFVRGDLVKTFGSFTVPLVIDRGVFQAGTTYEKGDGVTWAGSYWIAQESTTAKPGEAGMQSRAWRLAVKKGGDGKVGAKGDPGDRGPKGDQGPMGPARY